MLGLFGSLLFDKYIDMMNPCLCPAMRLQAAALLFMMINEKDTSYFLIIQVQRTTLYMQKHVEKMQPMKIYEETV